MDEAIDDPLEPFGPLRRAPVLPQAAVALAVARAKLKPPVRHVSIWRLFGASALCAGAALSLALAIIVGPPSPASHLRTDVNPWVR